MGKIQPDMIWLDRNPANSSTDRTPGAKIIHEPTMANILDGIGRNLEDNVAQFKNDFGQLGRSESQQSFNSMIGKHIQIFIPNKKSGEV